MNDPTPEEDDEAMRRLVSRSWADDWGSEADSIYDDEVYQYDPVEYTDITYSERGTMNRKLKAGLIGIPLVGAIAAGILLLIRAPLFFAGAILIVGVVFAGYHVGLWLLEKTE